MATKRAKPNLTTKSSSNSQAQPEDRISKLPDRVVHRILSVIPTIDVVRMSLLSKRWRRVWYSVPAFNFSDADRTKYFPSSGTDGFYNYVNKCLKHRKAASRYICDSVVTRFRLHVNCPEGRAAVDKCLDFAVRSKAEEIDLWLWVKEEATYRLPEAVLNMSSLSVLKVDGLVLSGSYSAISLPSLKYLSLILVELNVELLRDLISGCPLLEYFYLHYDYLNDRSGGLFSITSSTLKFLEIDTEYSEEVHVEASNLVSFKYGGNFGTLDISACAAIKNLSLLNCSIGKPSNLIFGLPVLENFTLGNIDMENHITFRGQNVKSIKLEYPYYFDSKDDVFEVTIEATNLTSFFYKGDSALRLTLNLPPHPSSCN